MHSFIAQMKLPRVKQTVVFRTLAEGALVFSTEDEVYLGLNAVGAEVWQLLPPQCSTLDEIVEKLCTKYTDVSGDVIRRDVIELLHELEQHGLLESVPQLQA